MLLSLGILLLSAYSLEIPIEKPTISLDSLIRYKAFSSPLNLQQSDLYNHAEVRAIQLYYTCKFWIGTPPQNFSLVIDTGSSYTWVEASQCSNCSHLTHQFNASASKTYKDLNQAVNFYVISIKYGDGSFCSGELAEDMVYIGDNSSTQLNCTSPIVVIQNDSLTGGNNFDGILGLGFNLLSDKTDTVIDSLFRSGVINKRVFAVFLNYLGQMGEEEGYGDSPSTLEIGSYDLKKHSKKNRLEATLEVEKTTGFWLSIIEKAQIGKLRLQNIPVIFDTGSTLMYVDYSSYMNILFAVNEKNNCIEQNMIICQCKSKEHMPELEFEQGFSHLKIRSKYLWYQVEQYCVLLIMPHDQPFWLLGDVFLQNYYTIYNMDNYTISFAETSSFASRYSLVATLLLILSA